MKKRASIRWVVALVYFLSIFPSVGNAESDFIRIGNQLEPFSLEDQHGQEHAVDSSIRLILFARNRAGAGVMTAFMEGRDGEFLSRRGILYVNDISAMPSFAATLFALPKMRRRPYPILLDREAEITARFPDKPGFATLIQLSQLKVRNIEFLSDAQAMGKQLEAMPEKN
ncbi:MAG TPA: hypothetical protein EYQ54_11020 [Myxococcales bacterium]|nr:hypothetical protein [Myxococcales bacterium]